LQYRENGALILPKVTNPAVSGLLFALAGFALLSFGDAVVKTIAGAWPGTAIASLRYVFGAIGLSGLLLWKEGRAAFTLPDAQIHWARGFCVAVGASCFFVGIALMPLAEATVISFANPIFVALLSVFVLREAVTRAAWMATGLAFVGVVIVIRPNMANVGLAGLLPLFTAFLMAVMVLLNRQVAGRASVLKMQVLISATAVPILLVLAVAGQMSGLALLQIGIPDWTVVARCALVACSASLAHGLIFMATERVSAATMAPVTYVQLLVATGLGIMWFGERPDLVTMMGSMLIIGAGLVLWRAQKTKT
jgi:drug/metabolite transporter (DMT)-like permease